MLAWTMFNITYGYLGEPETYCIRPLMTCDNPDQLVLWLKENTIIGHEELGNAFREAAEHGYKKCVGFLLEAGALPDLHDTGGYTALTLAARFGHAEVLRLLIDKGCKINKASFRIRATALHWAATNGQVACMEALLEAGININAQTISGKTPLMLAARSGHHETVQMLVNNNKCNIDMRDTAGAAAIHFAAEEGVLGLLELILNRGADINVQTKRGETPFILAARKGQTECLRLLIHKGADLNGPAKTMSAFHCAADNGHVPCVRYLLEAGVVDPNEETNKDFTDMHDVVINKGVTPLMLASLKGHLEMMKALVEYGSDCDKYDSQGMSSLLYAITGNNLMCVEYLLEHGADPNGTHKNGNPPIVHALKLNSIRSVPALLKANCNIYTGGILHSGEYISVFDLVMLKKYINVVLMFLAVGYNVNRNELDVYQKSLAWLIEENEDLYNTIISYMMTPVKLAQLSRNAIRLCLQQRTEDKINQLHVPPALRQYISLCDLDYITA